LISGATAIRPITPGFSANFQCLSANPQLAIFILRPMNTHIKTAIAATVAAIGLVALASGTVVANASPSSSVSAQDTDTNVDGAAVDTDGTQGSYKQAMTGTVTGGAQMSTPQSFAGFCLPSSASASSCTGHG